MSADNQEQHRKKKRRRFGRTGGIVVALMTALGYLGYVIDVYDFAIDVYEKITFTNEEVKVGEIKTDEVQTDKAATDEVKMAETIESDDERNLEELVKSEKTYTYRIRVITYASETLDTYQEKIKRAESFVNELNTILISGKYDDFIDKEDTKVPESAFLDMEKMDKYYIYVYVNESTGTIADMVKDVKTLNRKYEGMFNKEGWLGAGNKWNGLIIDYSDNRDVENKKTLSSKDLFEMEQLLY